MSCALERRGLYWGADHTGLRCTAHTIIASKDVCMPIVKCELCMRRAVWREQTKVSLALEVWPLLLSSTVARVSTAFQVSKACRHRVCYLSCNSL